MSEVVTLQEHWSDEGAAKTRHLRSAAQLLDRVVHVLDGNHRSRKETIRRNLAEIREPVVIGTRQRIGHIGIFYKMKSLSEPGRIHESLVDTHRIHILQPRMRIGSARGHRMTSVRIKLPDLVPRHPGLPDSMAR